MTEFEIAGKKIGPGHPAYVIAELSANHLQDFDRAMRLVEAAAETGADAVKLQTYTPETMTLESDLEGFEIGPELIWEGRRLYELYAEAHMPWDWQPKLKAAAEARGLAFFSSPFDESAVEFLEGLDVLAYKIASFELVDLPLVRRVATTGKPVILSTGMATLSEIAEAVEGAREAGAEQLALLKCNSAYPAPLDEMNLRTLPHLAAAFGVPVGLSDHTLGLAASVAAVALGANLIEKHLTLARADGGPDAAFSLEPAEFRQMVTEVHSAERALGRVAYGPQEREAPSRAFRRSLFVVRDLAAGDVVSAEDLRSLRPALGLAPRFLNEVIGRRARCDVTSGTPLSWDLLS